MTVEIKKDRSTLPRSRKRGFTLIELLVVIAIIAILAAILFPVFARARASARRSSCQSNLKQLGLGILQYVQDSDEHYPPYSINGTNGGGWSVTIQPYIKSTQLLHCPDSAATPNVDPMATVNNGAPYTAYTDYAINLYLGHTGTAFVGANDAQLTQPSLTVMLCDYYPNFSANWASGCGWPTSCAEGQALLLGGPRHLDGSNFAFADGHVKWYPLIRLGSASDLTAETRATTIYNQSSTLATSKNSPTFNISPT